MERIMINKLNDYINKKVKVEGWVHRIRVLKTITFVIIRDRTSLVQCIVSNTLFDTSKIKLESIVSIIGEVKESNNKINNFEIEALEVEVINSCIEDLPIEINKEKLNINLDTMLNNRVLSLRHKRVNSIFKVQNIIVNAFREYLVNDGFTEIYTPKLVKEGAEGGTEIFQVKYFENKAYLAQSPQFYKEMMVSAGFERVFEIKKNDLEGDLDPEAEKLNCEFIFLTHYPRKKRPMYTMPYGENETRSFDLLFRGIEITTGGQRIHNYNMLIENIKYKGLNPENYKSYTEVFKYGMPKHGGLAIGLERITSRFLNLENVREATLITRDRTRLIP